MTDERSREAGLPERAHHAGAGKPAAPRQRRMSAQHKQQAVLRVFCVAKILRWSAVRSVRPLPI